MDAELKAKWVAALRSGEYRQCKHRLLNKDGERCCLGVLAKICGHEDVSILNSQSNGPEDVQRLFDGFNPGPGLLADMNDGLNDHEPHTFQQIADYIEAHL